MKALVLTCVCLLVLALPALSQTDTITTVILIRHAEKAPQDSKDPELGPTGIIRAKKLEQMLRKTKVEAVYSTPFKRTRYTVMPMAESKQIVVQDYKPLDEKEVDRMIEKHRGKTIVIVGHSNTIPWTANYLLGRKEVKDFGEEDYDNLLIVSVTGKGSGAVTWLSY